MVDNMVNQSGMIRNVLGLPERDMVENVTQEEGIQLVLSQKLMIII